MTPALCLLANASEAGELLGAISGLRAAGATIRVAAPADHVASIEALGVSVDDTLGEKDDPDGLASALSRLFAAQSPAALLVSSHFPLAPLADAALAAARDAGVVPSFVSTHPFGTGLGRGYASAESPRQSFALPRRLLALEDFVDAAKRQIEEVLPEEALRILETPDTGGWHFVDVREPDEFAEGHVPGARSFPRGFLEVRADLVHYKRDPWLEDRARPMILYCGGGHRSAMAVATLQRMGFTRLLSLAEGWTGWTEREYPVDSSSGST